MEEKIKNGKEEYCWIRKRMILNIIFNPIIINFHIKLTRH